MLKRLLSVLTVKEYLIVFTGNAAMKVLNKLNYFNKYLPLQTEINSIVGNGYKVKSKNGLLCIDAEISNYNYRVFTRPQTSDYKVFQQVIMNAEYFSLINFIKEHRSENKIKTIVDAGANIGLTSLYLNAHFPNATIIAVEADESNIKVLEKNIVLNGRSKKITALLKALWKNNVDTLYISNDFRDGENWAKSVTTNQTAINASVAGITLKDILEILSSGTIDILKMDIEGAESILFEDIQFISLLKSNVRFLALEIHEECKCRENILDTLNKLNFLYRQENETTLALNNNLV
jgi:FkbM family methyltransferase